MLSVNIPDATIGVITSMASFAALFQLFTMQKINRLKKRKLLSLIHIYKPWLPSSAALPFLQTSHSAPDI